MNKSKKATLIFWIIIITLTITLFFYPNSHSRGEKDSSYTFVAKVLSVDNSNLVPLGTFPRGSQEIEYLAKRGVFKGQKGFAISNLYGNGEFDTYVEPGDKIVVALESRDSNIEEDTAIVVEHYRIPGIIIIAGLFVLLLVAFAGRVGVQAVFTFFATMLIIIKFLVPLLLRGVNPTLLITATVIMLSGVIIFSIAGVNRKGVAAVAGTVTGLIITAGITFLAGALIKISGYSITHAEYLISIGYFNLHMTEIFYGAVILGASGAAMDIAMDIAASMKEIQINSPNISRKRLTQSGFNIGKAVIGTMTTTLVLAYSGSYITLLMIFYDKNTELMQAMNMKIVSLEIMRTIVGSIGIVLVAPVTAIIAGFILCKPEKDKNSSPEK